MDVVEPAVEAKMPVKALLVTVLSLTSTRAAPPAPLPATDSLPLRARERQLILPDLGDLKIGKPHDNEGKEDPSHELHRVQQFLDLLAPREPKARIKS